MNLIDLIGLKKNFTLIYQASRDGFFLENFYSRCDKSKTLVVIQDTDGSIFGGYTEANWKYEVFNHIFLEKKYDKNAFIFFLTMKIFDIKNNFYRSYYKNDVIIPEAAIYSYKDSIQFGNVIKIKNNSNYVQNFAYSNSYEYFEANTFYFQSYFLTNEIEVYSLQ